MKLHEYQAKSVLARAGIPVPPGKLALTPDEAASAARELAAPVAVKAQVHVGGRGKAGGIKLARSPEEAHEAARSILGMDIKGLRVEKVYVERAAKVRSELYLGVTVDRDRRRPVVMLSTVGGMDIEQVASEQPEKIARGWPDPRLGLLPFEARRLCFEAGVPPEQVNEVAGVAEKLYEVFRRTDAMLLEINPLFIQEDGSVVAGDAKLDVDDNALFRETELAKWKEVTADEQLEERARQLGFSYVQLDGDVGVIGNGAGLVMSTLDAVRLAGGKAANFLDVGGGAKEAVVKAALEIVLSNARVRSVLINIFGGITRGDEVARGIIAVIKEHPPRVPLVIRLSGTEAEAGRKILRGAPLVSRDTMDDAAAEAVRLARESRAGAEAVAKKK
ncbi:MAG: ADP-forming succinate--CoA ligase subunit beta [Chloroflexota bacterium]|nr:ADP-forming succinate--CoA ligase subunit beta [Chloroflexota bacterium]MDE3193065.1 ADP-forming succinate--CoA ligase subunit beta [Chloroflexota bacterium]